MPHSCADGWGPSIETPPRKHSPTPRTWGQCPGSAVRSPAQGQGAYLPGVRAPGHHWRGRNRSPWEWPRTTLHGGVSSKGLRWKQQKWTVVKLIRKGIYWKGLTAHRGGEIETSLGTSGGAGVAAELRGRGWNQLEEFICSSFMPREAQTPGRAGLPSQVVEGRLTQDRVGGGESALEEVGVPFPGGVTWQPS